MMKLYLSGPIASEPDYETLFRKDAAWLEGLGYEVVNPVAVTPDCDGSCLDMDGHHKDYSHNEHSRQCHMKADIIAYMTCDGLAVQSGIEKSSGGILDIQIAMALKMPIRPVREWVSLAVRKLIVPRIKSEDCPRRDQHQCCCGACDHNTHGSTGLHSREVKKIAVMSTVEAALERAENDPPAETWRSPMNQVVGDRAILADEIKRLQK